MKKETKIKNKDYVIILRRGNILTGQFIVDKTNKTYLLSDYLSGARPREENLTTSQIAATERFKYSYYIIPYEIESNLIYRTTNKRDFDKKKKDMISSNVTFKSKDVNKDQGLKQFYIELKLVNKPVEIKLFQYTYHPDCYGCSIFYNFYNTTSDIINNLTDIQIKELKHFIRNKSNADGNIIHLAQYQKYAFKFVERLGAKKISEYLNTKSGHKISIYNLVINR